MRNQSHSHSNLDARSPLVLDTRDLQRAPGATRTLERSLPALDDLGIELIWVPAGSTIELGLRLESVSEGVLVSAVASGELVGECGRCLEPLSRGFRVSFRQLYAYEHSTTDETTDEDEVGRMSGDLIDLAPQLRDAVVLSLPNHPLCRPDCPGLCAECGVRWDRLPTDHSHQVEDPRWRVLNQLGGDLSGGPQGD